MHYPASKLLRILLPRTPVNRGKEKGRSPYQPGPSLSTNKSLGGRECYVRLVRSCPRRIRRSKHPIVVRRFPEQVGAIAIARSVERRCVSLVNRTERWILGAFDHEARLVAGVVCPTQIDALIAWGTASCCCQVARSSRGSGKRPDLVRR